MVNLVYILAASHSGSTLLAMLLGAHPEVATVGELSPGSFGNVNEYRCSCRSLFLKCPFWQRVAEEMERRGTDFRLTSFGTRFQDVNGTPARHLLRPLHRGRALEALRDLGLRMTPSWRRQYPRLVQNNQALIEAVSDISGKPIVVDSSKSAVRLKFLLRIPDLCVKVIRLIRDGRGVSLAYTNQACFADASDPMLRGGGTGIVEWQERFSIGEAAYRWKRSNEEAETVLAGLDPSQWKEIRYEELCVKTSEMMNKLFTFLTLNPELARGDFRSHDQHIIGNGMRLDSTSKISLDERWKHVLTSSQLRAFERVAGRVNRAYGYD